MTPRSKGQKYIKDIKYIPCSIALRLAVPNMVANFHFPI